MNEAALRERIEELTRRPAPKPLRIITDTTQFMNIWRGHVVRLGDRHFLIGGDMREGRFGIDEQPKFWVKRVRDLDTGEPKVMKLVFLEEFRIRIGLLRIRCFRDPEKEARVLDLVRGDDRFMQGTALPDACGNAVRVLDFIRGKTIFRHLLDLSVGHEEYTRTILPGVLTKLLSAFEAIALMHRRGLHHGDIRNDHIIIDAESGRFRWIDFDLAQGVSDFDVWSLGNILLFAAGKGEHTFQDVRAGRIRLAGGATPLGGQDASAFFVHRIINLRKLFPWIPPELNAILMHFSYGTVDFYESVEEILADLRPVVAGLAKPVRGEEARTDP